MLNLSSLHEIPNYYLVSDRLASSGQPTREQFQNIANAGYEVIINLALPTSKGALPDEGAIATGLGMIYLHLPVLWESPTQSDVQLFFALMNAVNGRKVWVHCAMNMRASCFLYLYRKYVQKLPEEEARYPMSEIWQAEGVWADLIDSVEAGFRSV
jgi:protein tyrosine phosphatase (PTP) superfamily phosphohydrolase (DUF442 family)